MSRWMGVGCAPQDAIVVDAHREVVGRIEQLDACATTARVISIMPAGMSARIGLDVHQGLAARVDGKL